MVTAIVTAFFVIWGILIGLGVTVAILGELLTARPVPTRRPGEPGGIVGDLRVGLWIMGGVLFVFGIFMLANN